VDSPLNSLEVFVSSNFDGLNVTKATWIPLKVILPKGHALVSVCRFWRCGLIFLHGKNQYRFQVHRSGKNLALDGAFQVDDVQIFGSKMGC
jgi:hypothetical protein